MGKAYYPLFADVAGRRCVIVGGGAIAERKALTLRRFGAEVLIVSPTVTPALRRQIARGAIRRVARTFRAHDLRGAWLVYAATGDPVINEGVYRAATRARIFTNVVDQPALCSFIAPALVRRGGLTIAIGTGGGSPSLAKALRRELQRSIGPEYARMLRLLERLRPAAKRRLATYAARRRYFERVIRGPVFRLVRRGRTRDAYRQAWNMLKASSSD